MTHKYFFVVNHDPTDSVSGTVGTEKVAQPAEVTAPEDNTKAVPQPFLSGYSQFPGQDPIRYRYVVKIC